jgi:hypothetical protein
MAKTNTILCLTIGVFLFATRAPAQSTNLAPATELESVEDSTDQLVLKGSVLVGSMTVETAVISLVCKEDAVINPGNEARTKLYGCSFGMQINNQSLGRTIIDEDEMDSLLKSIEYMKNITWSVTTLPAFNVTYTTKAGLRFSVFSENRQSKIGFSIRNSGMEKGILLSSDQIAQLYSLLQQTKAKVDALRKG